MTSTTTLPSPPPRKRNAEATRSSILEAAKRQFAQGGYDRVRLVDIAAEAGANVALIKRYFGGKEALFTEALKASFGENWQRNWDRETFAHDSAAALADDAHMNDARTHNFRFLLLAATSPATLQLLNVAIQERFLGPIRDWLGDEDAMPRARVLAAIYIGFLVERLIRRDALAGREREVFIAHASAAFDAIIHPRPEGAPAL